MKKIIEKLRKEMSISEKHQLVHIKTESKSIHGLDSDFYFFNEIDVTDQIIDRYCVEDSVEKHPPFKNFMRCKKL